MAQSTFEDDELFDEAADELREDVRSALDEAEEALPDGDALLDVDGGNLVGVLNAFKADLDAEDARAALREAKKWYETGRRAESFDDDFAAETGDEIDELVAVVDAVDEAEEAATDLVDSVATLKKQL